MTVAEWSTKVVEHALKRWSVSGGDDSYWRHWKSWCETNGCNPLCDDPGQVARMLADFEPTRGHKFIEKLKVAVSTFMEVLYGHESSNRISNHPIIRSQMTGSKKTKPSQPRYPRGEEAWDVGLIPKYWESQPDNDHLSTKELGFKLVSLWLALASCRVSCLAHLCRDTLSYPADTDGRVTGVRFQYWFTKELGRPVRTAFCFIPAWPDEKLCLVVTLQVYVAQTSDTTLFEHKPRMAPRYKSIDLSLAPPLVLMTCNAGQQQWPLSAERLSKWAYSIMVKAGVPAKYSAGSCRVASASWHLDNGQSLEYVMGLGRWSTYGIFRRHYDRSRLANEGIAMRPAR